MTSKNNITGLVILDKPLGLSSNHALQQVKRIFQAKKAGHTGSLDPLASGLLPITLGEATKFSQFLLDANKHYQVIAEFGKLTTTGDREGEVLSEKPIPAQIDLDALARQFHGEFQQIPPMYSALKHQGKPLYELARAGKTIDRPARHIHIHQLNITGYDAPHLSFEVICSKGTYVRTLVEDIALSLGTVAHVIHLRRLGSGSFQAHQMVTMEQLQQSPDKFLLPLTQILQDLPSLILSEADSASFKQGKKITLHNEHAFSASIAVSAESGVFLGVATMNAERQLLPKRLMS